ncbi:MAG TPA: prenyltransferase [Candidatus Baltobacteraceae bacterium]|jgi:1,4-dihydroxy-2-naphthoate octaprenyltransferase
MKNHPVLRAFIRLSRLKFLAGGLLGFALGAAIARYDGAYIDWQVYALGQMMVTSFHLMVHYANDYYDRFCDESAERTAWSGGSGALLEGGLSPRIALNAALVCAGVGTFAILVFAISAAYVPALVGGLIGVLCWSYSAPPMRLLARGWGELDTAVIIALLFPLAGYVTFAHVPALRLFASSLPSIAAMFVLMFCVEYPDIDSDCATGKLNLIARLGRERSRYLIYGAVGAIYAGTILAIVLGGVIPLAYFVALTIPIAWFLCKRVGTASVADVAASGVALFVVTILGSTLAYVALIL